MPRDFSTNPWTYRALLLATLLAAGGCGQQAADPNKTGSPANGVEPAATAPSPAPTATVAKGEAEMSAAVPPEKFGDGARAFAQVKDTVLKHYYAAGLTEDDVYRAATQGVLERVDPKMHKWNKLLAPSDVAALRSDLKGEIVGIGVNIHFDPGTGYTDVLSVYAGSPAEKAGVVSGDRIVTINGKFYKGLAVGDVVRAIRGQAGETVTLSVLHGDKLVSMPIRREVVSIDTVSGLDLSDGIGYVRIRSFSAKTPALLRSNLEELGKKNARALVLDLRGNPGGGFDDAIACAELCVPAGAGIVTLKGREGREQTTVSKGTPVLGTLPMVVLVDHETSSGAELLTAALQEGRRAIVVGTTTLGKWSVQELEDLPNGYAFKYTMAIFKSPSGRAFDGTGLSPDIEVDMDSKLVEKLDSLTDPDKRLAADAQLRSAVGILRTRL